VIPAVDVLGQATYLTAHGLASTGFVGNGWYDRDDSESFLEASDKLVQQPRVWDLARQRDPVVYVR